MIRSRYSRIIFEKKTPSGILVSRIEHYNDDGELSHIKYTIKTAINTAMEGMFQEEALEVVDAIAMLEGENDRK